MRIFTVSNAPRDTEPGAWQKSGVLGRDIGRRVLVATLYFAGNLAALA
jgi:hypothetical protein